MWINPLVWEKIEEALGEEGGGDRGEMRGEVGHGQKIEVAAVHLLDDWSGGPQGPTASTDLLSPGRLQTSSRPCLQLGPEGVGNRPCAGPAADPSRLILPRGAVL